jgi:threonine 3-dehydrogenase
MEPFGIGVHALSKTRPAGKKVAVFGSGPIGIYAQVVAKMSGAESVFAVDITNERLELAGKMGADVLINAAEKNAAQEIIDITGGAGVDIAVELSGSPAAAKDAGKVLRRGGDLVFVGLFSGPVELDLTNDIIYKEANVHGVTGRIMWDTWWSAQSMLLSGKFDIDPVVTHEYGLKDYDAALQLAESSKAGKIVFNL